MGGPNSAGGDLEAQAPGAQIKRGAGERLQNKAEIIDEQRLNVSRGQSGQCDEERRGSDTIPMRTVLI